MAYEDRKGKIKKVKKKEARLQIKPIKKDIHRNLGKGVPKKGLLARDGKYYSTTKDRDRANAASLRKYPLGDYNPETGKVQKP